jgi:hypothetical protein
LRLRTAVTMSEKTVRLCIGWTAGSRLKCFGRTEVPGSEDKWGIFFTFILQKSPLHLAFFITLATRAKLLAFSYF